MRLQAGVMVRAGITATSFEVHVLEDSTLVTPAETVSITKSAGTYVPQNVTTSDVKLSIVQNETTTTVEPGKYFYLGLNIEVPPQTTIPAIVRLQN